MNTKHHYASCSRPSGHCTNDDVYSGSPVEFSTGGRMGTCNAGTACQSRRGAATVGERCQRLQPLWRHAPCTQGFGTPLPALPAAPSSLGGPAAGFAICCTWLARPAAAGRGGRGTVVAGWRRCKGAALPWRPAVPAHRLADFVPNDVIRVSRRHPAPRGRVDLLFSQRVTWCAAVLETQQARRAEGQAATGDFWCRERKLRSGQFPSSGALFGNFRQHPECPLVEFASV